MEIVGEVLPKGLPVDFRPDLLAGYTVGFGPDDKDKHGQIWQDRTEDDRPGLLRRKVTEDGVIDDRVARGIHGDSG